MKKKILIMSLLLVIGVQTLASARDDMKYIDKLYKAKEYDLATDELKSFVEKYPKSSYRKVALDRLSKTLYLKKEYKDSITYFKEYLTLEKLKDKEIEEAHYYLARNNIFLKNYNEGKAEINKIPKESPKRDDALYHLGVSYYEDQNYEEAKKIFKGLVNSATRSKDSLLYLALSTYSNKEYTESSTYLDDYLKSPEKGKNIELANYIYGMNQYKLGNNEEAIKRLTNVETNYPKSKYIGEIRLSLLDIYLSDENLVKVDEYYSKIVDKKRKDKANTLLGNYYFANKNYENSYSYYKKIKDLKDPKTIYGLGYSMYKIGEEYKLKNEKLESNIITKEDKEKAKLFEESRKYFEKLKGTSFNSEGIYYLAFIEFKNKNYSQVIKELKGYDESKMKREYINNIDIFLGKSYYEMKDYKKARNYYERTYKRTQSKSDLYQLILTDSKIGDAESIKREFEEYKRKFPTDEEYRQKIYLLVGNTMYQNKDLEGAKSIYKEYLKDSEDPKISENYITILMIGGNYKELTTYLGQKPQTAENRYLMGVAFLGMTEYDKATKQFESVINGSDSTEAQKEKANYNLVKTNFSSKNYIETIKGAKKYLATENYKKYRLQVLDLEGLANFRLEKYDRAREIFKELGKNPKYKDYSEFQIAESYYNQGEYDKASKIYEDLYTKNKKGPYAMRSLYWNINILNFQNQYKKVIDKSKMFNIEYPKSSYLTDVNFYMANAYFELNDTNNAAKTYIEVYQKTSDENIKAKTARELTSLYYNAGDYKNANIWKDRIKDPNEKAYLSALIYEKQGKRDLAIAEYKKLIETKEYGSRANYNLATTYYKEKNYDEAKKYYENILKIENGQYKDTATYQIGQIYLSKKDYSKALRNFMRIELLYEKSNLREPAKLKIATIYEAQKEKEKAQKTYEEFYKTYPNSKYKGLVLEKLLVININDENLEGAKKYYNELLSVNNKVAKKYESYFVEKTEKPEKKEAEKKEESSKEESKQGE